MSIELRPHEAEAILNKFDAPRVRVFERVISADLKVKDPLATVEDSLTEAEVLRDAKGIVARALARGAAKIVPVVIARDYEHKTKRRWTDKQRAARSEMMRTMGA